jgi:lipopolysaccharide/colanic/teichoic acid biosynthesis glycosyltransferase
MRFGTSSADLSGPSAGALRGILSASELRAVVTRERDRTERSHLPFSLLIFTVGDESGWRSAATLSAILRERLRSTDEVGWLDATRIAAVLPYTPAEEAAGVLRSIELELARVAVELPSRIETYPAATTPRAPSRQDRDDDAPPTSSGGGNGVARPAERTAEPAREGVAAIGPTLAEIVVAPLPFWKRAMDVAGASLALLLLWPLFLIAAIAIKLDSPGPIFFRQPRVGAGGHVFGFFKLRTMHVGSDEMKSELREHNEQTGPVFKMRADPRITRVGRFLRRSSIDELPQFWNVLKGDMSLVGPRPPTPDEVTEYEPWQLRRLLLTPGITCFWQVSGRSEIGFVDWVRLDVRYAERRSPGLDLALLAKTLPAVLSGRGAF